MGNQKSAEQQQQQHEPKPEHAPLRFTVTPSQYTPTDLVPFGQSVEEMTAALATHDAGEKDGEAIIPAVFRACPSVCWNHEKAKAAKSRGAKPPVDCGGGRPHRLKENVVAMTMFGADLDHIAPEAFSRLIENLKARRLLFWWWHTYSHEPGTSEVRARVLFPFREPLTLCSPEQWSKGAWPVLVRHLGLEGAAAADSNCRDASRVFYTPRKPRPDATRLSVFHDGAPLDWGSVQGLRQALETYRVPLVARLVPATPEDSSQVVPVDAIRQKALGGHRYLRRIAEGKAPSPPPGRRQPDDDPRNVAWLKAVGSLSIIVEKEWPGISTGTLLAFIRPAWEVEVAEASADDGPTEWEKVVGMLERARASAAQKVEEQRAQIEADRRLLGSLPARALAIPAAVSASPEDFAATRRQVKRYLASMRRRGAHDAADIIEGMIFLGTPPPSEDRTKWWKRAGKVLCRCAPPGMPVEALIEMVSDTLERGRLLDLRAQGEGTIQ